MRKIALKIIILIPMIFILLGTFYTTYVYADAGPKPSISIRAKNMPDNLCYMDLLIEGKPSSMLNAKFNDPKYNQELVAKLKEYYDGEMSSLLVNNLSRTHGDIICNVKNGECSLQYSYMVPNRFKIIVVSEDGSVKVSNLIERKAFESIIFFDYKNSTAHEVPLIIAYIFPFLFTCLITLIIEGIILVLFRFSIKENIKAFILINILTQVFLYVMISVGMYVLGSLFAILFYLFAEIIIFIIEAILFSKLLKNHTVLRRVIYSITSNIASFFVGPLVGVLLIMF